MRTQILLLSLLMACSTTSDDANDQTDTITDALIENPYGEAKNCPAIETGTVTTKSAGLSRSLEVELPANPQGAPVIFAWHWLGGNATETLDYMQLRGLADEGYIIIAPETTGLPAFEWETFDTSKSNYDLALFDKMLPCLFDQFQIDTQAVYATGHSAGGLMTTFLTMQRADVLAATAPFSGGTDAFSYDTPDQPIPVLVTWGGASDEYAGYSFESASETFISMLEDDGSYPYACNHGGGHIWPAEAADMVLEFFDAHRMGEASAWEGGMPSDMPGFCAR